MAKGKVVQVIGTVVDMEFPQDELPAIYNGITIPAQGTKIIVEAQAHIGNKWVRGVALTPTDGLARGTEAIDMGTPVSVPRRRAAQSAPQWPRTLRPQEASNAGSSRRNTPS